MLSIFNQKKIEFVDDKKASMPLHYDEKNGDHLFKIGKSELKTDDYNPRSQIYKFNTFIIAPVSNKRNRYVAYEILKDDVKLIKTYQRFKEMIKMETSARFHKALSNA